MNHQEAYSILELSPGASEEEIKKQFRKLAAQYHPDINKDPGAETKSKQISEAYNFLKNPPQPEWDEGFNPLNDIINHFRQRSYIRSVPPIFQNVHLSFEESILGCTRQVKFQRNAKCDPCSGRGYTGGGSCSTCNGTGGSSKTVKSGKYHQVIRVMCQDCQGTGAHRVACDHCQHTGFINKEVSFDLKIPPGVTAEDHLQMAGAGHWNGMGYGPAVINLNISSDPDIKFIEDNLVSDLKISLLEALEGTTKRVRSIPEDIDIVIKPMTKNDDIVIHPAKPGLFPHLFNLNVEYPSNTDNLIKFLKENKDS